MRFRPCIDIHDGKVKQIVGGTLSDEQGAETNFVSEYGADYFGRLYKTCNVPGGHIILLNKAGTKEYMEDIRAASEAMKEFPGGFMLGASHVIVTSYVFRDGLIDYKRLEGLVEEIGKEHLVLDLSCRRRLNSAGTYSYYIVTDRWQKFTDTHLNHKTLDLLSKFCDEYLIHAVDVEGKKCGVDKDLLKMLGEWKGTAPITYAGGVSSFEDMDLIRELGQGKVDVTVGSALSIFGGDMDFQEVVNYSK